MPSNPILVTVPYLPDFDSYVELLRGVWERKQLTNQGPLVRELEERLASELKLDGPVYCVANGGLGLQLALRALDIRGKVITTPFSYAATSSCPLWEGRELVYADIEREGFGIDPSSVETRIDSDCEAILATHVFGNPCDVLQLEKIASRHGLALIYDAAHAFGVAYRGESLLQQGDLSIVSTHATKVFQTVEGGFVAGSNRDALNKVEWMRRFGHLGEDQFHGVAINAKMSELHAAMGLSMLPDLPEIHRKRELICSLYDRQLIDVHGVEPALSLRPETDWNYAYYPVLFDSEGLLLERLEHMNAEGVFPRRYFHPPLDRIFTGAGSGENPVSDDVARRILCLPLHHLLTEPQIGRVTQAAAGRKSSSPTEPS